MTGILGVHVQSVSFHFHSTRLAFMGHTALLGRMPIEIIRTQPSEETDRPAGVMDISEMPTDRVRAVANDADVYLERRGGKTYLVPA